MEDLDYHDIDDICRAARAYRLDSIKKDEIETGLGSFENNFPHALSLVPFPRPAHRIRSRRGRLQVRHLGSASNSQACIGPSRARHHPCQQASRSEDQIYHANRNQIPAARAAESANDLGHLQYLTHTPLAFPRRPEGQGLYAAILMICATAAPAGVSNRARKARW